MWQQKTTRGRCSTTQGPAGERSSRIPEESERRTHGAPLIPIIECLTSTSKITTALITDGIIKAETAHHQVDGLKRPQIQRCFWMSWTRKTRPNDGTALTENEKSIQCESESACNKIKQNTHTQYLYICKNLRTSHKHWHSCVYVFARNNQAQPKHCSQITFLQQKLTITELT